MSFPSHRRIGMTGVRELWWALAITVTVMAIEGLGAWASGSLALLADAGHMLTDALALGLSLFAATIARRPATSEKTFGYYRTEILVALVNGVGLWLLMIWLSVRAAQRWLHPEPVISGPMLAAAVIGLLANLFCGWILYRAGTQNLNVRAAWVNVVGDGLGSCGVIAAAILIRTHGWLFTDPLVSLAIALLIGLSSWTLVRQSVNVLLEAVPAHLDLQEIMAAMRRVPGVRDAHDVHLWTITTGLEAMSGHVLVDRLSDGPAALEALNRMLAARFSIEHTTFQVESADRHPAPGGA